MPPEDTTNTTSAVPAEGNLPADTVTPTTPAVETVPVEVMPEAAPEVVAETPAAPTTPEAAM